MMVEFPFNAATLFRLFRSLHLLASGPDYMESFSPSCRCLTHVVKALLKINYDYMEKVSARIAEVKFQPGPGKPGIPRNRTENFSCNRVQPGLKQ